jgi:Flp pilus assembly protein TadG
MSDALKSFPARAFRDERGQVLPWMALLIILFLGLAGLSMDLGQAYVAYRELQASSDAAALAGGYAMGTADETTAEVQSYAASFGSASSCSYSGSCPGANVNPNLPSATISVSLSCNSFVTNTVGIPCSSGPGGYNAVRVVQTAKLQTPFIRVLSMFGVHTASSLTITATSTAAMKGAANSQYNVAVVLDSTGSMSTGDTDNPTCKAAGWTKEQCALNGIQTLLSGLTPCGPGSSSSLCNSSFDTVGLFTFPNVKANTAVDATTCTTNSPQGAPYMAPVVGAAWSAPMGNNPNYQITSNVTGATNGYLDNYSATNASGGSIITSPANPLEIATGADTSRNCNGLTTPISGQGTYLAGAIYAAQSSLVAAQTANPGSLNAIVLLTDGDAPGTSNQDTFTNAAGTTLSSTTTPKLNTNGAYPSMIDQCQQAIGAAQYAASNGTSVYIVAYQAGTSGCSTDASAYQNPCTNLQKMALDAGSTTPYPAYFYSDATTANGGACASSANPNLTLNQVFQSVTNSFTHSRLIPN